MKYVNEMNLETERLIIRPYIKSDFEECFQLMQDPELFKYLDMNVMSREEYADLFNWLIDCYQTRYDDDFKYSFNIISKQTGNHLGWCGIGGVEYNHDLKEIFYLIGSAHQGNGYAKEAVSALLDYAFNVMELEEVVGLCKPDNLKSKYILETLGLKYKYKVSGLAEEFEFYNDEPLYALTKDEYFNNL